MARVVWWEIETSDPDAFRQFHGPLWGWDFHREFEDSELDADYWVIMADGQGIGGLQRAESDLPPNPGPRLYVEVEDLEHALLRVEAGGGRVERSRTLLGTDDRWFAVIVDPVGVSFGLWTPNPATP